MTVDHRRFLVVRDQDVTGLSGTGVVAEGVEFTDGTTVVRWRELPHDSEHYQRGVRATTVTFPNVGAVEALHGHGGATRVDWLDGKPPCPTCSAPTLRETVGMVCPTCGTDYARQADAPR